MNIRPARQADIPSLLQMGERFFAASGYADITAFDAKSFRETLERMLEPGDGIVLVIEKEWGLVGMAAALVYPFYFNQGHRTAQELFWWVDEEHRGVGGKLFEALREETKKRGAKSLSMIALDALKPEFVGAFYERKGLRPSERSYIGRL